MSERKTVEGLIRREVGALRGALRTREAHPTYGVTKASLRDRLSRIEGISLVWVTLYDDSGNASPVACAQRAVWVVCEVDYTVLARTVAAA